MKTNIIIIGATCVGKTELGLNLANTIGFGFIDLDEYIEKKQNKSIKKIFQEDGENKFREYETNTLSSFNELNSHVVVIGAGALNETNLELIKKIGVVVCLKRSAKLIAAGLLINKKELQKRPILSLLLYNNEVNTEKLVDKLITMEAARNSYYDSADVYLDLTYVPATIATTILIGKLQNSGQIKIESLNYSEKME